MSKARVITGLAGAAAMAGSTQAYGAVVNVPLPANIVGHAPATSDNGTNVLLDLNGDGQRDLRITYRNLSEPSSAYLLSYIFAGTTTVPGSTVGSYISTSTGSNQAYAFSLARGTTIGSASSFYQNATFLSHLVTNYAGTNYGFTNYLGKAGSPEFVGFKFATSAAGTTFDYGYIELETDAYVSAANPGGIKFLALAYDNSGAAITIPAAVPEPGTLAALAFGAATCVGVGLKRRRAAAAAQA